MLTLRIAVLRHCIGKSVIIKSWNLIRGKKLRYQNPSSGIGSNISWREILSILDTISNITKLVNCNQRPSFPQYIEFSNVL